MKKSEISAALAVLKEIKMPKLEDKALRNTLIENHFALLDAGKKVDAAIEAKKTVFLEAYKEEEGAVQRLREKMNMVDDSAEQRAIAREINEHTDYFDAIKAFNEDVNKLYAEEVPGLKPVDHEKFMEEIMKMDDMKLTWVEALYPMFVLEVPAKKEGK